MADFTYDLAFSFLTPDQDAATSLHRRLSPPHSSFLYTEQQQLLAGADGYEKFAAVFAEHARMVVLVYRDGWGERGFTYIERTAIKRRIHAQGADFLFIVIATTEPRQTLPDWLPGDHVYWDLPTFGVEDAVDAIRQRLRRIGGAPRIETAVEMALRQKCERIAASEHELFRQTRGLDAARQELRAIFAALSEIAAASAGTLSPPEWNRTNTAISFTPPSGMPKLTFALQMAAVRTPRDPDLHVRLWRGGSAINATYPGIGESPSYKSDYQIDLDEGGRVGWRPIRAAHATILSSNEVADREVKELLTRRNQRLRRSSMRGEPFDVCWDRIARADTHRNAVAKVWAGYLDDQPYAAHSFVRDDGTGDVSIEQVTEIPKVIALEIGEYLYQMRAALDACVYEAACLTSGQSPPANEHRLEFPITDTPEAFAKAGRKIESLQQPQRVAIEALQPFNMPATLTPAETAFSFNRGLAILNDWARKDRHRKLHVAASWASNVNPMLAIPPGTRVAEFTVLRDRFILKGQGEIEIATFRIEGWQRGMTMRANPNLTLDLVLEEPPSPCDDKDTLNQRFTCIQYAVETAIDSVAQTFGIRRLRR